MAAVSAELAALRERQLLDRADTRQEDGPASGSGDGSTIAATEAGRHTVVRDDRWERWWPEAPEDDEPFTVVPARGGTPRHASHRGRSAPPGRPRLAPVHLSVLALLVAGALGFTAWWVARSSPEEVTAAVPAMPLASTSDSPAAAAASSPGVTDSNASPQSAIVVVHVAGKVMRPGVQELPLGARVADAVRAAGGPRAGVSLTSLNLARRLEDGEQVLVGAPPGAGGAAGGSATGGATGAAAPAGAPVNLNTANESELDTLPGVGPVTAAAIVEHREKNGAFTSVDQLIDVSGIGEATLAKLAPLVSV